MSEPEQRCVTVKRSTLKGKDFLYCFVSDGAEAFFLHKAVAGDLALVEGSKLIVTIGDDPDGRTRAVKEIAFVDRATAEATAAAAEAAIVGRILHVAAPKSKVPKPRKKRGKK
jgi:hypothetical protein